MTDDQLTPRIVNEDGIVHNPSSWRKGLPLLLLYFNRGPARTANEATEELHRMADYADRYVESQDPAVLRSIVETMVWYRSDPRLSSMWLELPIGRIYVRQGFHRCAGESLSTLDLANININEPGRGAFRRYLAGLESTIGAGRTIYVENALSDRFYVFLIGQGYSAANPNEPDNRSVFKTIR